jgi:4-methyl-5(b-hydroxyethyl)-thiazole monophosphate biosynthesis
MKKVAVLLAAGFEEVEVVTPVDFLRRAGIEVVISSINTVIVTGANGIAIKADCVLDALPSDLDGVILPGGMPGALNLAQSAVVTQLINTINNENKLVAAICAAPALVLGGTGLLKGRKFTCYPGFEDKVTGADFSTERVVQDGNIINILDLALFKMPCTVI